MNDKLEWASSWIKRRLILKSPQAFPVSFFRGFRRVFQFYDCSLSIINKTLGIVVSRRFWQDLRLKMKSFYVYIWTSTAGSFITEDREVLQWIPWSVEWVWLIAVLAEDVKSCVKIVGYQKGIAWTRLRISEMFHAAVYWRRKKGGQIRRSETLGNSWFWIRIRVLTTELVRAFDQRPWFD